MKHNFKLTRLWVASLLLLFGVSQPTWADKMMYLDISQYTWYDNAYAHYWGGTASDQNVQMQKVPDETYVYYGKIPSGAANILFVRIVSNTWYNQTYDWNNFGNINYFKLTSQNEKMGMSSGTYVPKMKSLTIANNGTTTISGSGTEASPYIIAAGATIKVKATAALQVDDSNPTFKYKYKVDGVEGSYGDGNNTYQFTAGNDAHTYAVTVRAYATYNSTDNTAIDASNTIYFKIATYTGLTIADNPSGYVTAASILSANQVVQGQSVTITKGTPKTGYEFKDITVTSGGTISGTTWTPSANNQTATVNWTEKTHNITISNDGNGSTTPSGVKTVGEVTGISITATPNDGFGFKGWDVTGGAISANTATTTFYPTADNATIQATFQSTAVYYTWAFGVHSSGGGTVSSNVAAGSSVRGGTAITLTAHPATGYEVDGWYDNQDCTGQALQTGQNTYSFIISDNSVRYVKFKKTDFAITYTTQSTGWTYGNDNPTTANYQDNVSFVVTPTAGYTVTVSSSDATLDATGAPTYTFTMPAKAVAISVSATENMTTVTVNANETTWGTVSGAVSSWESTTSVGVTTSATLTATKNSGYKFVSWALDGGATLASGALTDATITIKGDGSSANGTAVATFAEDLTSDWYVEGDAPLFPEGWSANDNTMMKHTSPNSKKVVWTLTVSESTKNVEKQFKIYNKKTDKWYGWEYGGNQWTINSKDNNVVTLCECSNIKINLPMAGDYEFSLDDITKGQPILTVKWPSVNALNSNFTGSWARTDGTVTDGVLTVNYEITQAMVDSKFDLEFEMIYDGTYYGPGIDKTEMTVNNHTDWELSPSTGHHVVLKPSVAGQYTFVFTEEGAKLDVTYPTPPTYTVTMAVDGPGTTTPATSVELNAFTGTEITATPTEHSGYHFKNWTGTDGITFADANVATTTAKATGTGTITAHFEKDTYIYFNNTIAQKWKDSPLYIYLYKEDGYWDEKTGTGAQTGGNYMNRYEMTKLPNTEIWSWHYDQLHNFQGENKITYVAFSDKNMDGYKDFYNAEATYKSYNDCMNMFVPDASQTPKQINNTDYYNDGFWRQYNDEHSKMYLHIWDVTAGKELKGAGYELTTKTAGNDAFNAPVKLENNHQYNIYIGSCDGKNYSRKTTINSDNCSGIQLYEYTSIDTKSDLAYLYTGAGGNYVFTLTYDKDKMTLSVEYPVTANDYRVKTGTQTRYSNIIRSTEASGTISMFLNAGDNTLTYEEATNVDVDPIQWGNTKSINVNVAKAGVYTMTLTKGTTPTITDVIPYTGKYYVRTDCAQGGWNEYKTNDNNLMRYTERQPDYEDNPATGFNYYYCRWNENAEGNVRFVIANEINPCISDTLKEDAILDNTEFLKGKANIRFSWNSNTNALNRAYISGSYDDEAYLQVRSDGSKLFKKQDGSEPITAAKLDDNNDWTYIIDVYANGGAQAAVSAKYNDKYQFFVGAGNAETGAVTGTIQVIKVASKAHMQLVYDFKTDRIVTGWIPGDVITADITLQSDAILTRVHQGQLSPIKFLDDGISVLEVQTMYGVLQLDKDIMTDGHTQDPDKIYERNIYWISFPFDVRVGDIFGVDGYGEKWVMQRYNGAKRAEIGWFAETATFWEYMDQNDIMEANVGYTLTLDPDYFDNASDAMWANSKTSVSFYFPSVTHNIDVVSNGQAKSSIPARPCKIDREFGEPDAGGKKKNHKITDSDWNVIGIPTFQDLKNPNFDVESVYKWDPATNTYSIQALTDFTLEASHAYFVQWGCEDLVTWPNASIIKPRTAPYAYADAKNYMVELFFSYGDKEDHTYVKLADGAHTDFVLNEDMMKVTNSGQPNIYSYAGAYDVAYNATAFENQTVNLGVIARKNGSYTFAMPKDFSGKAVLVDLESGEATDLNLSNYTVELNKGTYNNRFQLLLEVEAKAPTNMNPTKGEWSEDGKTKKLFINDNIYLINAGRIYNASGTKVR